MMKLKRLWPLAALVAPFVLTGCGKKDDTASQRQAIGHAWKYETKGDTKIAYIGSANSVATPTAPDTFAVLLLNSLDTGETGVTIKTVGAPFFCDLSDCSVTAVADGGKPKLWQGRMTDAQDGIFIPPARRAFETIKDAKKIKITVGFTPKSKQAFEFDVAGLNWKT
ncbi:hypothetical protein [Rhizorhapis suberifaciens]|uniref:Lipoprotein n=1 Tax=Rhizorhapis suberifaciens TaxID=13656 RepID=A0A840HU25_9SPHN|nr:hypothetical protein [Rhizorhapis suberifaciens]MBB4641006.1 hypothetical protein [Rhizorhapis suberifaciens]